MTPAPPNSRASICGIDLPGVLHPGRGTGLRLLLHVAMVVVSFVWIIKPFNDPDFFWHLKTGEWIWQHRQLPLRDPFTSSGQAGEAAGARFTLSSYWLSQVLYHLVHTGGGMPGIVVLKFLIAALLVRALLALRRGDAVVHGALTLVALPLLYGVFPFDRPQAFSFVFFAWLLARLEQERTAPTAPAGWASYLPVPLLMLAWANMHGGHAVGQATIALYLALEGVKFAHPALQPAARGRYRRLLIVGSAGLAASLLNPNSWRALGVALLPLEWIGNFEYLSTLQFYRTAHQPLMFIFWGALALAALSCLSSVTRPDITRIALLAGTGYHGFLHVRFVPFFLIAALPVIAAFLPPERVRRWARYALAGGSVALVALLSLQRIPSREQVGAALRVNEAHYPVRAVDFVIANDLTGNLYNTYVWGGYLLWRLGPAWKVFVDGRGLDPQAIFLSGAVAMALPEPPASPRHWKNILRQQGVGMLIIPRGKGIFADGSRGLRAALSEAPEWVPVFADKTALVFVLNTPEHRDVISRHGMPATRLPDPLTPPGRRSSPGAS